MKRVFVLIFILAVTAFAAEKQKVTILDFSPGLVTAKGRLTKAPNELDIAWNVDFTTNRRQSGPRLGYGKQTTVPFVDSILWNGISVANYRSGDKQFMAIGKWTDSAYAGIFGSDLNGFGFGLIDSIMFVPDTATGAAEVKASAGGTLEYCLRLRILKQGVKIYDHINLFDTFTFRSEIVDDFLTGVDGIASCAACSTVLRFYDHGDSLSLAEADEDFGLTYVIETGLLGPGGSLCDPPLGAAAAWDTTTVGQTAVPADIILSRFPATGSPRFAQFRDNVYIVNGTGRGAVYNGRTTSEFPMRAPGEAYVLPLLTQGTMHGRYRYAVKWSYPAIDGDSVLENTLASLGQPVRVDSSNGGGQVMIYNWPIPNADAWHETDSAHLQIWRSIGTLGILDKADSVWLVDTIIIANLDSAESVVFIDTMSDSTLRIKSGQPILQEWGDFVGGNYWRPDSSDAEGIDYKPTILLSPGTPSFTADQTCTDSDSGLWLGGANPWGNVVGWAWMVVPKDTVTDIPGDSSQSVWLYQNLEPDDYTSPFNVIGFDSINVGFARSDYECVSVVIPRIVGAPNTIFDLYRAPIIPSRVDSTRIILAVSPTSLLPSRTIGYRLYAQDFETPVYYFIGQFNPGDTLVDSLQFDSLLLRDFYRHNVTPSIMLDVTAASNRLIAMDEGNVYMTDLIDTLTRFNVLDQKPVNPDDGDQNTGLWSTSQGVVKVAKNRSLYNLYRSNGLWQIPEFSDNFGMVAPLSHAKAPEGDYFLSLDGVKLITEGQSKTRSFIPFDVSSMLSNFDDLETSVLKNAIGIAHDNKYILSFPDLDTAFVLNVIKKGPQERTFGWSQWDLVPIAHALYRVSADNIIIPGDSLYFALSGDPSIYVLGSSEKDDGADVFWQLRTGPLNQVDGNLHYVEEVAMYFNSDEEDAGSYFVSFYNEKGEGVMALPTNRLDTAKYHEFDGVDTLGGDGALFWQFDIQRNVLFYDSGTTSLEGLWITTSKREKYGSQ